jgi:hypothetical protein
MILVVYLNGYGYLNSWQIMLCVLILSLTKNVCIVVLRMYGRFLQKGKRVDYMLWVPPTLFQETFCRYLAVVLAISSYAN